MSGLFGKPAQPAAPGSPFSFGNSTANPSTQPAATGGLFGGATTAQPASAGGLFGNSTAQPATSTGGGLFGNSTAQPAASTGGGLFGNTSTAQPATSTGGGLFGNSTATTQPATAAGGGLFGAKPAMGTGFGTAANPTTTGTSTGGGLFGNTTMNQPATSTTGIFGQKPTGGFGGGAPQLATNQGLFASLNQDNNQPASQTTGYSGLSSMMPSTAPGQSAARVPANEMKPTTRYNDLYEEHQRAIENFDKFVLQQMAFGDECKAFLPGSGEKILELPDGVEFLKRKLNGVVDNIRSEAELVRLAKELFEGDKRNVELSHNVLAELKVPVGYRHQGIYGRQAQATTEKDEPSTDIVGFFSKTADELAETLDRNKKQLAEIELHLRGLEGQLIQAAHNLNGGASAGNSQLQEVGAVLREFEVGILGVAGAVGNAREGVNALEMGNFMQSAGRDNTGRRGVY